jgi:hypothetical protein
MTLGANLVPSFNFDYLVAYTSSLLRSLTHTMESFTVQGNERPMTPASIVPDVTSRGGVDQSRHYMTSIGDIPADILYTIAQYADSPRDLVFVCKRWRDIVLFAPSLWTNIHITFPKAPPHPGHLHPERMARAALRRAGPTTKLSLHLEMHEFSRNISYATAVVDMISERGYQFIRELRLDGSWFPNYPDSISSLFSRLVGEWNSLLHLHLGVFPPSQFDGVLLSFLDSVISTAPALQHIGISANVLPLIEKKLSKKRSLITLEITRSFLSYEPFGFSVWPHIKSLKVCTTGGHQPPLVNRLDLRAINPPSSAEGDISAFPLLTHAVVIHHTLELRSSFRLKLLTDLVLSWVDFNATAPHSVELPLLRNLVVEKTREIDCIVAPMLETLSIGPLLEAVNVGHYLSDLFSGHPQQLDPVHLDLRPISREQDLNIIHTTMVPFGLRPICREQGLNTIHTTTVPLASVYLLKRVERISISRLSVVRDPERWKYRMLESPNSDTGGKQMIMLPKWKEMDLGEDVPDWLWDIIIARQVAGFPVQLNQAN